MSITYEQQARDILERCGWKDAQSCTAGDVVEVANLLAKIDKIEHQIETLYLFSKTGV